MSDIIIKLKASKDCSLVFAEGPNGEILYLGDLREVMPEVEFPNNREFNELRDAVLDSNYHLNQPGRFVVLREVPASQGIMEAGLPPLTGEDMAKNDMRRGIQVVSAAAMKELKG